LFVEQFNCLLNKQTNTMAANHPHHDIAAVQSTRERQASGSGP
jgi:hypothetical protein